MSLFQRFMATLGYGPMRPDDPRAWGASTIVSASGISVTRDAALQLDVVQGVLEVLAGSVSTLPIMVFRRDGDANQPARDHPLFRVLHERPNARQTPQEFRDEMTRHLAFDRNAYARILSDGNAPVSGLEPIHPVRVSQIERGGDGRFYYTIAPVGTGQQEVLRDDQIWHIRKPPLTVDGLRGVPVWETGREVIGRALAVELYGARFFRNSGKSGGIIKHPGTFRTREDRDLFLETWRAAVTGDNQHSDRLLTHGVDYVPLGVQNDEAQFIETLKQVEIKLCRLWQMPPHRVQSLERATHSNIEHQGIDYVVHTLSPWITAWEEAASRDLLVGDERRTHFVEFNVAGLLRGDIQARYRAYALGRQWGWLSINDVRRLENMAPIGADGDRYLEPLNMAPAGSEPVPDEPPPTRREGDRDAP